jgi:hypothetical protein
MPVEYEFRALYGLQLYSMRRENLRESMLLCRRSNALSRATGQTSERACAGRAYAGNLYHLGKHAQAPKRTNQALDDLAEHLPTRYRLRAGVDALVAAIAYHAMISWSLGMVDSGLRFGRIAMAEARRIGHAVTLCVTFVYARALLLALSFELRAAVSLARHWRSARQAAEGKRSRCRGV